MMGRFLIPLIVAAGMTPWADVSNHYQQKIENAEPKVTIDVPAKGSFEWNTVVPYHILVDDKEDGNSKYDEIEGAKVIMSIRLLPDSTQLRNYLNVESGKSQEVLLMMSASTCFNCHQMKEKLIGPSFASIAQKYTHDEASVKSLAQKVITGTSGSWGDVPMPPHPEMTSESVEKIVTWILNNASDPNQNYLRGLEGVFRTSEKPIRNSTKAIYVLKATYADNGDKQNAGTGKIGQDVVVLKGK